MTVLLLDIIIKLQYKFQKHLQAFIVRSHILRVRSYDPVTTLVALINLPTSNLFVWPVSVCYARKKVNIWLISKSYDMELTSGCMSPLVSLKSREYLQASLNDLRSIILLVIGCHSTTKFDKRGPTMFPQSSYSKTQIIFVNRLHKNLSMLW